MHKTSLKEIKDLNQQKNIVSSQIRLKILKKQIVFKLI